MGNSLIVVEHDEDTMRAADCVVDIGPGAGEHGGELVEIGTAEMLMKNERSITGAYLSGRCKIPVPTERKQPTGWLKNPWSSRKQSETGKCRCAAWHYDCGDGSQRFWQKFPDQ